jgi:hypothetical protein
MSDVWDPKTESPLERYNRMVKEGTLKSSSISFTQKEERKTTTTLKKYIDYPEELRQQMMELLQKHGVKVSSERVCQLCEEAALDSLQTKAWEIYDRQIREFSTKQSIRTAVRTTLSCVTEIFEHSWKYLFRAGGKSLGTKTGAWFEHLTQMLIRTSVPQDAVIIKQDGIDRLVRRSGVDLISCECKSQGDITSIIRNGLSHLRQSPAKYAGIICCTNSWATDNAIEDLTLFCGSEEKAISFLNKVKEGECGLFLLDAEHFIGILGVNTDEFKLWNGKNHANCGGTKAWKPQRRALLEIMAFLQRISR